VPEQRRRLRRLRRTLTEARGETVRFDGFRRVEHRSLKIGILSLAAIALIVAGCHRQGSQASSALQNGEATIVTDTGGQTSTHDPHAMTSIDVATGDLAGWEDYAGGRAVPPAPKSATAAQPAAASPEGSVAASDDAAPAGSDSGVSESIIPGSPADTGNAQPSP
jgi:hypothetical protein